MLCIWAAGALRVDGFNPWTTASMPILTMMFVAFWEELVFRGIVFRMMEEGLGTWIALLVSAAHDRGQFARPLWWSTRRSLDDGGIVGEMRGRSSGLPGQTVPRSTTHSTACPVVAATRSKSLS